MIFLDKLLIPCYHCGTMIAGLPHSVSVQLAAVLAGVSRQTFAERFVHSGLLRLVDRRVVLADLERVLGKPITVETYLAADRSLDDYREKQRARREAFTVAANAATALNQLHKLSSVHTLDDQEMARRLELEARSLAAELAFEDDFVPAEPVIAAPAVKPPVIAGPKPPALSLPSWKVFRERAAVAYFEVQLQRSGGNITAAARASRVERATFDRLIRKLGIKPRDYRHPHSNSSADLVSPPADARRAPVLPAVERGAPLHP